MLKKLLLSSLVLSSLLVSLPAKAEINNIIKVGTETDFEGEGFSTSKVTTSIGIQKVNKSSLYGFLIGPSLYIPEKGSAQEALSVEAFLNYKLSNSSNLEGNLEVYYVPELNRADTTLKLDFIQKL